MDSDAQFWAVIILCGVSVVVSAITVTAWWIVNKKAGRPGWAALVPIYNFYTMLRIAGRPGWWLLLFILPVANLYFFYMMWRGVAANFGRGDGFAAGLCLAPFVFMPILAFGEASYQPTGDGAPV